VTTETVRCVVFDIDDTLYLERDYVRSGFRAVGAWAQHHLRVTDFSDRAWRLFEEGARRTVFDAVLHGLGIPATPALVGRLVAVYRSHEPGLVLAPDARACLDQLRGRVAVAVVTDGDLASQRAKAKALGLERWADPLVFTAHLGTGFGKPHLRPFEMVQTATACSGPACVYVADNPAKDFGGPKRLGWATVRIRRQGGLHRETASGDDVDVERDDLSGLVADLGLAR
jgi:putative hydrolase of the HAD superfamily